MNDRRLVGIDLGIASAHSVRVLNGEGDSIGELPTMRSLTDVETAASAGTRLEVVKAMSSAERTTPSRLQRGTSPQRTR